MPSLTALIAAAVADGGGRSTPVLSCTAEGELQPAGFSCEPHVCPSLDCWSLRSRERPRLQGVCPSCWYGCLDTGSPPTDVSGTVIPNPGTCTIGCRDGFREDAALATNGSCTSHSNEPVPLHSTDCEPLLGFQPCWGGNAGGIACVPSGKPCPTAPKASYAGMTATCIASTCPAPDLGPTLKGGSLATPSLSVALCLVGSIGRRPYKQHDYLLLPWRSVVGLRGRRAHRRCTLRNWMRRWVFSLNAA